MMDVFNISQKENKMSDVFNISQKEVSLPKILVKNRKSMAENNLAVEKAEQFAEIAEQELRHGGEAIKLAKENKSNELRTIAEWHFRRCMEKARLAKREFSKARKLLTNAKRGEDCRLKVERMSEIMVQAKRDLGAISAETN